jgi:cellulose synthase/poly-beta-1,6-N-acetylglucosamine synthase-like glycosyltransferase
LAALVFWSAIFLVLYTYGGYLLLLVLADAFNTLRTTARYLSGTERRRNKRPPELPTVSVLIAAHNEAACIKEKIENTLAFDFPPDKLEILVGSDGSTDGTDEIVRQFAARGVKLSSAPRAGKASVLNRLAELATGHCWLFTDANTHIEPDALKRLVGRASSPNVGAVCGRLELVAPSGAPQSEGLYWRYENLLKFFESRYGALMGANGGLYLLRRSEWAPLPADTIVDDFLVTMRVVSRGRQVVYEPSAIAREETAVDLSGEFKRRVRIAAGNFQSLRELWPLLARTTFAGFAFWSHKVLRWTAPFLLAAAFVSSALLSGQLLYAIAFLGQAAFYGLALFAHLGFASGIRGASTARYFVEMNVALALGLYRYLTGRQRATWQRTIRTSPEKRAA